MVFKLIQTVMAPWIYLVAKLTKRRRLVDTAVAIDPYNLRATNLLNLRSEQMRVVNVLRQSALLASRVSEADALIIMRLVSESRAQFGQDMIGLLAAGEKQGGYFVEVGVGDGETLSNTFLMERSYGWSGLLCEPNRSFQDAIRQSRRAKIETRAIYRRSGEKLEFLADSEMGELSRLVDAEGADVLARSGQTYTVPTVTLNDALAQAGAPSEIDFMSIDTEGSELAVLDGFDPDRWRVGMVAIEHNNDAHRRKQYRQLFQSNGYIHILEQFSVVDDWFVHKHYAPKFIAGLRN